MHGCRNQDCIFGKHNLAPNTEAKAKLVAVPSNVKDTIFPPQSWINFTQFNTKLALSAAAKKYAIGTFHLVLKPTTRKTKACAAILKESLLSTPFPTSTYPWYLILK